MTTALADADSRREPLARVVLHAAGGPDIGVGHLRRTGTLADALAGLDPSLELVLLWEASGALAGTMRGGRRTASLELAGSRSEGLCMRDQLVAEDGRTALMSDILRPESGYFAGAREAGYAIVAHLNDSGATRASADLLVDEDPASSPPEGFRGRFLSSTRFRMIAAELVALRGPTPWRADAAARVTVALGGADPRGLSERLLTALVALPRRFETAVQIGPAFAAPHVAGLERIARGAERVSLSPPTAFTGPLLAASDLVVTLGGITAYEAMCLGRPGAAVRDGGMAPYVGKLAMEGLLVDLGEPESAAAALVELAEDGPRLAELADRGHRVIDGNGARRVARSVLEL
ncbi:MAG TPA: hypothetical protein VKB80_09780 [Kofleriaceae bacterium]|nr:hypothetical protein [Kofleriaceae bacterium]